MSSPQAVDQPNEVASKVLRRAQVSKMTRVLQDRLALANIKIKHGWQNLSISSIEPELEKELKRKRSNSNEALSDSSSTTSDRHISATMLGSSPISQPIFSDEVHDLNSSRTSSKRSRHNSTHIYSASSSHSKRNARMNRSLSKSWKRSHQLPQSSPIVQQHRSQVSMSDIHNVSFASRGSINPREPNSPSASEDDDSDLPLHSFQFPSSGPIASSPPRTPPPGLARSARLRAKVFSSPPSDHTQAGKEGADLLLYLAASPSPAMRVSKSEMFPPSTPPAKNTPLPSSMMSTPGGQLFLGFGPNTPGGFNFGDFVNVTPSPAQATWNKTPGTAKTPLVGMDHRRRIPTMHSPNIVGSSRLGNKTTGLGMELGGELVS